MIGIYKITNQLTQKVYIGQSTDIAKRWEGHLYWSNDNTPIHLALKKYGIKHFSFEVIEECSPEELDEKEVFWIKHYNSFNEGYNATPGGQYTHLSIQLDEQEVIEHYHLTKSIYKTAEAFSVHRHTISKILDKHNIQKQNVSIRSVLMIDTKTLEPIQEFLTIVDAASYVGVSESAIRKALKSPDRTSKGYYWCLSENFQKELFTPKGK